MWRGGCCRAADCNRYRKERRDAGNLLQFSDHDELVGRLFFVFAFIQLIKINFRSFYEMIT